MDKTKFKNSTWANWKFPDVRLKNIIGLSGISEPSIGYYNEFQNLGNKMICAPIPSVSVELDIDSDLEIGIYEQFRLYHDSYKFLNILVRRTAFQRKELLERLNEKYKYIVCESVTWDSFYVTYNSLLLFGADLDAYHLNYTPFLLSSPDEILREILCTRSSSQIKEIQSSFMKIYKYKLSGLILENTKGSKAQFFLSLIDDERSGSIEFDPNDPLLSDHQLFLDEIYFKKNKQRFIDLFTKKSYFEIRRMCEEFEKVHLKSLIKTLKGNTKSKLKKYAKTICAFSINSYALFSKLLREHVESFNQIGIIRIITSRAEIDLMNILRIYRNKYKFNPFCSIKFIFALSGPVYSDALLPLMGLPKDYKI